MDRANEGLLRWEDDCDLEIAYELADEAVDPFPRVDEDVVDVVLEWKSTLLPPLSPFPYLVSDCALNRSLAAVDAEGEEGGDGFDVVIDERGFTTRRSMEWTDQRSTNQLLWLYLTVIVISFQEWSMERKRGREKGMEQGNAI